MAKNFTGEYVSTKVLGTMSNNRQVELGHYVDGDNEFGEKIYITGTYTSKKDGSTKKFINATKLTLADLIELQQLDLTGKKEKAQTSKEQKPKQKAGRPKQSKGKANLQVVGGSDTASLFD